MTCWYILTVCLPRSNSTVESWVKVIAEIVAKVVSATSSEGGFLAKYTADKLRLMRATLCGICPADIRPDSAP